MTTLGILTCIVGIIFVVAAISILRQPAIDEPEGDLEELEPRHREKDKKQ